MWSCIYKFFPNAGLDAAPPASTHELTIPNDVSQLPGPSAAYLFIDLFQFIGFK